MLENLTVFFNNILSHGLSSFHASIFLLFIAFLGGIVSSLSPCTLGILPLIIGYVAGYGKNKPHQTFIQMLSFSLGLSFVLSLVGILSVYLGRVFTALGGDIWVLFIASLVLVLGLNLLGVLDIYFPQFIKKMPTNSKNGLFIFPFIIGMFFALASTPCSTPILVSILGFASLSDNVLYSILLLFVFALGQTVIMILAGMFTTVLLNFRKLASKTEIILKISGVILILCALYMYYRVFSQFF